jgi:hypothetical protein
MATSSFNPTREQAINLYRSAPSIHVDIDSAGEPVFYDANNNVIPSTIKTTVYSLFNGMTKPKDGRPGTPTTVVRVKLFSRYAKGLANAEIKDSVYDKVSNHFLTYDIFRGDIPMKNMEVTVALGHYINADGIPCVTIKDMLIPKVTKLQAVEEDDFDMPSTDIAAIGAAQVEDFSAPVKTTVKA